MNDSDKVFENNYMQFIACIKREIKLNDNFLCLKK